MSFFKGAQFYLAKAHLVKILKKLAIKLIVNQNLKKLAIELKPLKFL